MEKMIHVAVPPEAFETRVCENGKVLRVLPKTARGTTYNVGKNANKRAKRAFERQERAMQVAWESAAKR